jgi:hypothetical protein
LQRISRVLILEEAANDLVAGRDFYDKQGPGVGQFFWDCLISDIESLTIYAGIHQRDFGLFRLLSKRFPYAVYYEIVESVAYVLAILPIKRDPDLIYWQLGNRS